MSLLRALTLSIVVHLLLILILDKGAPYFEPKVPSVTTIDLVEKPGSKPSSKSEKKIENNPRQIVRQALAPQKELKEDDSDLARFLSADRQRVRREMQAATSGLTVNRSPSQNQRPGANKSRSSSRSLSAPQNEDPEGTDIAKNFNEYVQSMENAPSTIGEALPQDVTIGHFTSLNTDRYVYYSFFARIEELVRFRWESRVRQFVDSLDRQYVLTTIAKKSWVTSVDIWLTRDGRYHSAHILKESGIPRFDQAAITAFKEAGMFPNPPQEMVEEDGFIHLKYSFNVHFNPKTVVYSE